MFKEENNVETVLRLREMLVRAMMAENDVMQELVLSKLEEISREKMSSNMLGRLLILKVVIMQLRSLLRRLRMALKRQLDWHLLEPGMLLKSLGWLLQRSIELP
ncbi:MAG: hypothetical protein AWL62_2482 [Halanaerobium sp. T82-1]|nr:MAG: hypothetical protein AWL62_2482 [Halanaerobium sp. T82-1]